MTDRVEEWVDRLERAAVTATDSCLRRDGVVAPVTVHVLSSRRDPSYVAWLVCRSCQLGMDAAVAVASMGVLPAALSADRVVVCWERVQLAAELEVPGALALPPGLVVLDADRTTHEVRFHPFDLGPAGPDTVAPRWGPVNRQVRGQLPEPVGRLLGVWRAEQQWSPAVAAEAVRSLEVAGYGLRWVRCDAPADVGSASIGSSGRRAGRVRLR